MFFSGKRKAPEGGLCREPVRKDVTSILEYLALLEEEIAVSNNHLMSCLHEECEDDAKLQSSILDMMVLLEKAQTWAKSDVYEDDIVTFSLARSSSSWDELQQDLEELFSDFTDYDDAARLTLGTAADWSMCRDEKSSMVRYVDEVRHAAQGSQRKETGSSDKYVILPTSGRHEHTFIFLHGFKMEAKDMLEVFVDLSKVMPTWRFVLPQAPLTAITAHGGVRSFSWFDYLTDQEGLREDTIDIFGLRRMKVELQNLASSEKGLLPEGHRVVVGGLSQGGTMALHLAASSEFQAVVTAVACRLSCSTTRPLKCPWHALIASADDVFPSSWSSALMKGVSTVRTVVDNHYLEQTDMTAFFQEILLRLQTEKSQNA